MLLFVQPSNNKLSTCFFFFPFCKSDWCIFKMLTSLPDQRKAVLNKSNYRKSGLNSVQLERAKRAVQIWKRYTKLCKFQRQKTRILYYAWKANFDQRRQKEWRNLIRSNVHHNYNLYCRIWGKWAANWKVRQEELQKYQLAKNHGMK